MAEVRTQAQQSLPSLSVNQKPQTIAERKMIEQYGSIERAEEIQKIEAEQKKIKEQQRKTEIEQAKLNPEKASQEVKQVLLNEAKKATQEKISELKAQVEKYRKLRDERLRENNDRGADSAGVSLDAAQEQLSIYENELKGSENSLIKNYYSGKVQQQALSSTDYIRLSTEAAIESNRNLEKIKAELKAKGATNIKVDSKSGTISYDLPSQSAPSQSSNIQTPDQNIPNKTIKITREIYDTQGNPTGKYATYEVTNPEYEKYVSRQRWGDAYNTQIGSSASGTIKERIVESVKDTSTGVKKIVTGKSAYEIEQERTEKEIKKLSQPERIENTRQNYIEKFQKESEKGLEDYYNKESKRAALSESVFLSPITEFSQEDLERAYKGYSGTALDPITFRSREESGITTLASIGLASLDTSSSIIVDREIQLAEVKLKVEETNQRNKLNTYIENLNLKIQRGEITQEEAQKLLDKKISESNSVLKNLANSEDLRIKEKLKKFGSKVKLNRAIVLAPFIAASSFVGGAALALAPETIQTGVAIGGGLLFEKEITQIGVGFVEGDVGITDLATFGITSTASFAGFAAGAKYVSAGKTKSARLKLDEALKRSNIEISTEGIINEGQLLDLDLSQTDLMNIKTQIESGASIRKIKAEIKPRSTTDQELIFKELPYRDIEFVEIADRSGNIIDRVALGKIKLQGKSGEIFKQEILSKSEGFINPEGLVESRTLTLRGKEGKFEEAILTTEESSGRVFKFPEEDIINIGSFREQIIPKESFRIVKSGTEVKLIESIKPKGRSLTQRELNDLFLRGEGKKGTPISESQFFELQKRTGLRYDVLIENALALAVKRESFIGKGKGISELIVEETSMPKQRKPKTPFENNFPEIMDQKEIFDIKEFNKKTNIIKEKNVNQVKNIIEQPSNIETGIRSALEQTSQKTIPVQKQIPINLAAQLPKVREKEISKLNFDNIFNNFGLEENQKIKDMQKQISSQQQGQNQLIEQALLQPQLQIPSLQMPQFQIPELPINFPTITIPEIIRGKNIDKSLLDLNKKVNKKIKDSSKYTASLSAAVADYGIEVDEKELDKQLKELDVQEFTGLEIRPLLKVKKRKSKKKK